MQENTFFDVFISYGRADSKAFATQLNAKLVEQGLNVWFDQNDIPPAVDFQEQINDGIEKAHNFIFIIAPHSVNSIYCGKEIDLAIARGKRIIPILHVEQISQQTWQQRYPEGTEADWQTYRVQGKHSSFPNMHPTIGKINWVNCREGIDDLETALAGLLEIFKRHQTYVEQHTLWLAKALSWERNNRQPRYFLVGEERQAAAAWLQVKFENEQPPCEPTDLHCEFICESIKQANNGMTQVFLSHSDRHRDRTEKIRHSLMGKGITVWTNRTDIKTGVDFQVAIERGIQGTDNIVYLISKESLRSSYCQQEIDCALALNKRIIPLLIEAEAMEEIPSHLRVLQLIDDFVAWDDEERYQKGVDKLLGTLHRDAPYYQQHKNLLVNAIKWQEQNYNPCILLRGLNLENYRAWLETARQRTQHLPTVLQEKYIAASVNAPDLALEVFISCSLADLDFARPLNESLQIQGKTTWFDRSSLVGGAESKTEIFQGIERSDNFLFILTPSSAHTADCIEEVEYASKLNKRIVAVIFREVDTANLHPILTEAQRLDFNQNNGDFHANFSQLIRTLDTDREHVHSHNKWWQRAKEWEKAEKNRDLLLRSSELAIAQTWLEEAEQQEKNPQPTPLHQEFIAASQAAVEAAERAEKERQEQLLRLQEARAKEAEARLLEEKKSARRQKMFLGAVSLGLLISSCLGMAAFIQSRRATLEQIKAIAGSSEAIFVSNERLDALIKALEAQREENRLSRKDRDTQLLVTDTLSRAVFGIEEMNRLSGHYGPVLGVSASPDGQYLVSGSADNTLKLWQRDGTLIDTFEGHEGSVLGVAFSPDGEYITSGSSDRTVKLWQRDGTLVATFEGHEDTVRGVAFSPDGKYIVSGSSDRTVKLWQRDGTLVATFEGHQGGVNTVAFDPQGETIASASDDRTVKLWQLDGTLIRTFAGHQRAVLDVAFSPDNQAIATASQDQTVRLWQRNGTLIETLSGHNGAVSGVEFSNNGQFLVSSSWDRTIRLWERNGTLLMILRGHTDRVTTIAFSFNNLNLNFKDDDLAQLKNLVILSGSEDNTVRLWRPHNPLVNSIVRHRDGVWGVDFSPDGRAIASSSKNILLSQRRDDGIFELTSILEDHQGDVFAVDFSSQGILASAGEDRTVKLWNSQGELIRTLEGHRDRVYAVDFHPNGEILASASEDRTIKLWNIDGTLLKTLEGHDDEVRAVVFDPEGEYIVSGSFDNTVKVWNLEGELLHTLAGQQGHQSDVSTVAVSPNGEFIASGSADNTIKLWNRAGQLVDTIEGHGDTILAVKFSPDGGQLASASVDRTIKLWDISNPSQIPAEAEKTLRGHGDEINVIDWYGDRLLSGSSDRRVILWNQETISASGNPQTLLEYGCAWAQDYLENNRDVEQKQRELCQNVNLDSN